LPILLAKPRSELMKAEDCLASMKGCSTVAELEASWSSYLNHIERVWNKVQYQMKPYPRFNGWKGKYEVLRKNDKLLIYLTQARGSSEHTTGELFGVEFRETDMAKLGIIGEDGKVYPMWGFPEMHAILEKSELLNEAVVHLKPEEKIVFKASAARLNIVHNRGRSYEPPKQHLNQNINENNPILVAELGLIFYRDFVADVEANFS
jgi:hypothetical protein